MEVATNDREGLLYTEYPNFNKNKLIISMVKISTNGDFVEDSFHLRNNFGFKIKDAPSIEKLKKKSLNFCHKIKKMFLKIVSIIGSLTLVSRILGYVRDLLIARFLGAGLISDAFFVSFKLPNLFRRLFAEGSLNSAFIPVVSGIQSQFGKKKSDEFFQLFFHCYFLFLFILLIICELFMPLIISLIAPVGLIKIQKIFTYC